MCNVVCVTRIATVEAARERALSLATAVLRRVETDNQHHSRFPTTLKVAVRFAEQVGMPLISLTAITLTLQRLRSHESAVKANGPLTL